MLRLKDLVANMPTGVPYTEEQIMAMVRKGKQRGHIPVIKEEAKRTRMELELLRRVVRTDDRMSQMLTQFESQPEIGGGSGSGSGGGGDDEPGGDEDADGDEDAGGDEDI
ncbi:hypothetical protein Tco_0193259 [Tanacetum coccineum]